jgi:hypothetical protein
MPAVGRGGRGPYPLVDLELALTRRAFPNPAVVLWRWRYEAALLALVAVLAATAVATDVAIPAAVALGPAAVAVGVVAAVWPAAWPAAWQRVAARFWCVVTPHRVRTACAETWLHNRSGKLPMVLWTSAEPYGERVLLWCRAGLTAEDLQAQRATLAAACWAEDVEVIRDARRPHLVTLEVIRRRGGLAMAGRPTGPGDVDLGDEVRLLPPAS